MKFSPVWIEIHTGPCNVARSPSLRGRRCETGFYGFVVDSVHVSVLL